MKWIEEEFEHTKLGDKRLDKRLKMIVEDRISNPEGSLANSKEGNKAVKAMYRFLIIDKEEIYHFGASLKDLGKKWFAFSKFDKNIVRILNKL